MTPLLALIIAAGWLKSNYLSWIAVICGSLLTLALMVYVLRYRRANAVAVIRHPFAKYVIFSIVAHIALATWLWTSHWFDVTPMPAGVTIVVDVGDGEDLAAEHPKLWDQPPTELVAGPVPKLPEQEPRLPEVERPEVAPAFDHRVDSPLADLETLVKTEPNVSSPFADAPKPPVETPPFAATFAKSSGAAKVSDTDSTGRKEPGPMEPTRMDSARQLPESQDPKFSAGEDQQVATVDELPVETVDPSAKLATDVQMLESTSVRPRELKSSNPIPPIQVTEPKLPPKSPQKFQTVSTSRTDRNSATSRTTNSKPTKRRADGRAVPAIYRDRWAGDRMFVARARGGSEDTEAAVRAALVWLAKVQGADGRWDASQFGSGRPVREGGHDRGNAGVNADTATTGLALLAFLGSGHTHLEGKYADNVRRGVEFLVRAQQMRTDGSLVGQATGYAAMYCHGIATLALSEAYSLTGDQTLQQALGQAVRFSLSAQHSGGSWRYRPREPGDTSQLGWQLMAITSAHYAGYAKVIARHPNKPWASASRFLDRVAPGDGSGLAAYKPGHRPTRTMTAEALLCRLLLNTPTDDPRIIEGADYLMAELPGQSRLNYYYWYYGTLGLYHLQDEHWLRWNNALKRQLTALQRSDGSWPTENSVWGNAGGTVYTTALAAMTLEVYYRYRPFSETHRVDRTARRP